MKINKRQICFLIINLLLISIILLNNDLLRINLIFRKTSPIVFISWVYIIFSFLLLRKWYRLKPLSNIIILSFFTFSFVALFSSLILNISGELINSSSAFSRSWNRILYRSVIIIFLIQQIKSYINKEKCLDLWVRLTTIVIIVGFFQILAVMDVSPFSNWFLWENIRGGGTRIASTFRWQGPFVLFLGLTLPILVSMLLTAKQKSTVFFYGSVLVGGILAILYSGSRTSLAMLPLTFAPFMTIFFKNWKKAVIAFIILATIIIFIVPWDAPAITRAINIDSLMIGDARYSISQQGISLWSENPILGIGTQQLYEYIGFHPHNSYLEVLIESGLLAFIPFIVYIISIIYLSIILSMFNRYSSDWIIRVGFSMGLINFLLYNFSASAINYYVIIPYLAICISYYENMDGI
ncbi:MAG: O-antigen ligase family protein [bacterium]